MGKIYSRMVRITEPENLSIGDRVVIKGVSPMGRFQKKGFVAKIFPAGDPINERDMKTYCQMEPTDPVYTAMARPERCCRIALYTGDKYFVFQDIKPFYQTKEVYRVIAGFQPWDQPQAMLSEWRKMLQDDPIPREESTESILRRNSLGWQDQMRRDAEKLRRTTNVSLGNLVLADWLSRFADALEEAYDWEEGI